MCKTLWVFYVVHEILCEIWVLGDFCCKRPLSFYAKTDTAAGPGLLPACIDSGNLQYLRLAYGDKLETANFLRKSGYLRGKNGP